MIYCQYCDPSAGEPNPATHEATYMDAGIPETRYVCEDCKQQLLDEEDGDLLDIIVIRQLPRRVKAMPVITIYPKSCEVYGHTFKLDLAQLEQELAARQADRNGGHTRGPLLPAGIWSI